MYDWIFLRLSHYCFDYSSVNNPTLYMEFPDLALILRYEHPMNAMLVCLCALPINAKWFIMWPPPQ